MTDYVINISTANETPMDFPKKNDGVRSRAERRKLNVKKARRKQQLSAAVNGIEYDHLHEYSKNKIHCSCPSCSGLSKTGSKKVNKGGAKTTHRGLGTTNHRKGKNYKPSEIRKIEAMDYTTE